MWNHELVWACGSLWGALLTNLLSIILSFNVNIAANVSLLRWSSHAILIWQKHPGSLLEGFVQTQVSSLAVKNNLVVVGGFQGELICKVIFPINYLFPCTGHKKKTMILYFEGKMFVTLCLVLGHKCRL